MDCSPPGSSVHGIFPGENTGVGCPALLQGIFPTRGLNLCLLHWQVGYLPLSHQGSPHLARVLANKHLEEKIAKDLEFGWGFQKLMGCPAMTPEDNDKDNTS